MVSLTSLFLDLRQHVTVTNSSTGRSETAGWSRAHPELTELLHAHLDGFGTDCEGRLFRGERGREPADITLTRVWRSARARALTRPPAVLADSSATCSAPPARPPPPSSCWSAPSTDPGCGFRNRCGCPPPGAPRVRCRLTGTWGRTRTRPRPRPCWVVAASVNGLQGYARSSNSPALTPLIQASISARVNRTAPFSRWLLLRTAIRPSSRGATSTQSPPPVPPPPEKLLLRHSARVSASSWGGHPVTSFRCHS